MSTWKHIENVSDFLIHLIQYTAELHTIVDTIQDIKLQTKINLKDIIHRYKFQSVNISIQYINGNIIQKTFIYHKQLDKLIQHTFSRILNRCASLKGGYYQNKIFPLFYVGYVFNLYKDHLILTNILESIIDKLISYKIITDQINIIYTEFKHKTIFINQYCYYIVTNVLINRLYEISLYIKDKIKKDKIVKKNKQKPVSYTSDRICAEIYYIGGDEDILPYVLQLPLMITSLEDQNWGGINFPVYSSVRKGVKFCILGWLVEYFRDCNHIFHDTENYLKLKTATTQVSVDSILNTFTNITNILKYYNKINIIKSDFSESDILKLIHIKYTYAMCVKQSNNILVHFNKLWLYLTKCSKQEHLQIIKLINTTLINYNKINPVWIILFDDIPDVTDTLVSVMNYTLSRINKQNINISLFGFNYTNEKENFASHFLLKYCKPCKSYKNPKFLTATYQIGTHPIYSIYINTKINITHALNYISDIQNKFTELICRKIYDQLPILIKTYNLYALKFLPCIKCNTINTSQFINISNKKFISCKKCKSRLCLTCFKYHDTISCSQICIKDTLLKMVNINTKWNSGETSVIGLSNEAVCDMMKNAFDMCNPSCFCDNCLSHETLTYLESDLIACNHVLCPLCRWSGCFMCGQYISSDNYLDSHMVSMSHNRFMEEFSLLVHKDHLPHDPATWRCHVSVYGSFLSTPMRLVDIMWILLNLATLPDNILYKWGIIKKRLLSILFAPNSYVSEYPALILVETCRQVCVYSQFCDIILAHPGIKTPLLYSELSEPIQNGLSEIWTKLFYPYKMRPYFMWSKIRNLIK